jgi:hypothetical protein
MVPLQAALDELNLFGPLVTEGELERALRDGGIETRSKLSRLVVIGRRASGRAKSQLAWRH